MRTPCLLAALLVSVSIAHAQNAAPTPLPAAQLSLKSVKLTAFIPRGWHTEKQLNDDLNHDSLPDTVLVLVQNEHPKDDPDHPTPQQRALVVALSEGRMWRRVGFSNTLLYGTRDGGALYGILETPVEVSIEKGVITIEQDAGSREVSATTYRLRFDKTKNRVFLIGYDQTTRDRVTGKVEIISCNFLTGQKKITDFLESNGKTTVKTARISRQLRTLESVRSDEEF